MFLTFQTLLEAGFIAVYNLFYTSLPVLAMAFFDQDVAPGLAHKVHHSLFALVLFYLLFLLHLQYPNLYHPGHKSLFFNYRQFTISALQGFVTSMVLFMIPMGK